MNEDQNTRSHNLGRLAVAAATIALALGLAAGSASAATGSLTYYSSGTAAASFVNYNIHTIDSYVVGTLKDTKADGSNAYVYESNYYGSWGSWGSLGHTTGGSGTSVAINHTIGWGSAAGTRLAVCAGPMNSSQSNCAVKVTS